MKIDIKENVSGEDFYLTPKLKIIERSKKGEKQLVLQSCWMDRFRNELWQDVGVVSTVKKEPKEKQMELLDETK